MTTDPPALAAVIGRNVREIRKVQGWTGSEVARRCTAHGMAWTQGTVSLLESGGRPVELGEFLILAVALGVSHHDLLAGGGEVTLAGKASADLGTVAEAFSWAPIPDEDVRVHGETLWDNTRKRMITPLRLRPNVHADFLSRLKHPSGTITRQLLEADANQEAERKAAPRLGMSPFHVALFAHLAWGQSLTARRDAVVGPDANHAKRGWATRQLIQELEQLQRKGSLSGIRRTDQVHDRR
jgi:transcriptional regulator with XRE-family HTH domain